MDWFHETSLSLGNNRHHMPVCVKMISSKVSMAITCMSLGTLQVAAVSSALVAGGFLVSTLLLQLDTIFQHISLLQIGTRILCNMLSWASVHSQLVGKFETFTYVVLQIAWAVRPLLSPVPSIQFHNCLCDISSKQLELLVWKARHDNTTSPSQFLSKWLHWIWVCWIPSNMLPCGWLENLHKVEEPYCFIY